VFKRKHKVKKEYNDITFVARNETIFDISESPVPAKTLLPEWYKNIPTHMTKTPEFVPGSGNHNSTLKHCMPFLDSWSIGYIMTLPCDVFVEKNFDGSRVNVHSHEYFSIVGSRGPSTNMSMPIPEDYYQVEFVWQTAWEAHTPEGYSSLYTHPINRPELPFYTISGVMDTDKWWVTGNHPFFIKKGFEGVIPLGTPMMSIIPFKREDWVSDKRAMAQREHDVLQGKVRRHASMGYKKECWTRKDFS
jgi:hypothetical protein